MKKRILALVLAAIMVVSILPVTVFATGTSYAITNGSPEDGKDTNHGYITIDNTTAEESDTVTVEAHPAEGYQLKSLTATPVAPTISTIADVLATIEEFPEGKQETGSSPEPIGEAWSCGSCCAFGLNNQILVLKASDSMQVPFAAPVTKGENCYTASNVLSTLTFNMKNGILTSITHTHKDSNLKAYDGTYTPASEPSARLKPITPAPQQDGTYQFTMPNSAVTVTAEFEAVPHIHDMGTEATADDITFTAIKTFADLQDLFTNGGSGYLANNIDCTAALTVAEGKTVNLCLNDKVLNLNKKGNITVVTGAEFNLYDCGTGTTRYYDKDATTGLWTLNTALTSGDYTTTGGVITGGSASSGGGVYVNGGTFNMTGGNITGNPATGNGGGVNIAEGGTFTMTGGTISGNTGTSGGGVCVSGTFAMEGGNIVGNTATENGGGVYVHPFFNNNATFAMEGGTITGNTASGNGGGVYIPEEDECLAAGTPITLANGTKTAIENLKIGDEVRVFDHESGEISSAKLFSLWKYPTKQSGAFTLHFTHGIDVTAVGGHCFFDKAENRYAAINTENVNDYIGHEFYNVDGACWETLTGVTFLTEAVDTYIIVSEKHLNVAAGGMLSNEDGIYTLMSNIFDFGENLTIDAAAKAEDIAQFGLWDYENMQYFSRYAFDALNLQYMSVLFGRGILTPEEFAELEAYSAEIDPELYCSGKEAETTLPQKAESKESLLAKIVSFLTAPFVKTAYAVDLDKLESGGVYFGGTAQVVGNKADDKGNNVYLCSNKYITLGTGTGTGKNGVAVPDIEGDDKMNIGVTMANNTGKFTTNGTEAQKGCFAPDDADYAVRYDNNSTTDDKTDDFLKLVKVYAITNGAPAASETDLHGCLTINKTKAAKDDTVTVTVTPSTGYRLTAGSLKVNNGGVEITASGTDFVFTMPASAVTVTAAFEEKTPVTIATTAENFTYGETGKTGYKDVSAKVNSQEVSGLATTLVATYYKKTATAGTYEPVDVPADAGNYKVVLSVPETNESYTGSKELTFTIAKRPVTLVAGSANKVYDGNPLTCTTFTVKEDTTTAGYGFIKDEGVASVTMTEGSTISDVGSVDNVIGTPTAKNGTNLNNYVITTEKGTLTVTPAAMTITATAYEGVYDGKDHLFETKEGDEITLGGISYVVKDAKGNVMDASEYKLFVREKDKGEFTEPAGFTPYRNATSTTLEIKVEKANFTSVTTEATFKITKAPLTVTAKAKSISYGDAAANDGVEYTGFVDGETEAKLGGTLTYAYRQSVMPFADYTTTSPAGTYDIIPSGLTSDNYKISFVNGTLTVNRADITPEVSITDWTYGNTANDPSVTGNSGSGTVTYKYKVKNADDSTYTTDVPTNAGDYTVRATVAETTNYNGGSDTADFTIEKATWATPTAITEGSTVNYVNETITVKAGYELSLSDTFASLITTETGIDFTKTYYLRKAEDNNHNASEGTFFSFTRPAAPAASAFTMTGETVENKKDGSFSGITAAMEYSTDNGTTWAPGSKTLTGLSNETVKVRYKATTAAFKSSEYSYTFTASTARLTVSFGDDAESQQLAYGAKVDKPADPTKSDYTFGGWYSDEECTQAWNFAIDTVKDNMTLYPKWIRYNVQKAAISGSVKESSNGVSGATVELFLGTVKVAATVTNDSGNYSFDNVEDGIYNIVVTKADGKTKTELVTVNSTGSFTADVALPAQNVNSVVEHKGNEVPNTKSDINETVVGGLDIIASNTDAGSNKVTIKLTVEPKAESEVTGASDIKALAGSGKKVEFLDLSLWKITTTTQGELKGDIGNANSALLTIVIPFDFSGVSVSSVMILRQHGTDSAEPLTKNPAAGQEGFTVNATEGTITIYAKKFSTYAMAYAEQSTGGHGGGSYTPGHTVTSDLKNVTKLTVDGKVVDSRYYTVDGGTVYLTGEFMKTLANGKHTVKLYDGLKVATGTITVTGNTNVISAPTGDAGLALYAALSVSSVLGMGWVGRKKHGEE